MEAWFVRNAWPGNLKKSPAQAKIFVPVVHPAITRMHPTCQRANSAHLGMPNRRPGKRRALNAVPVSSMVILVWLHVNRARITRITATKEETAVASIVQLVGRPPVAVPNAKRAARGRSAMVAKIAHWGLQEKEMTLIRRSADHVNWARQRRWKARPRAVDVI